MPRSITLGNGELCVALDEQGMVHDLYYPYVGKENHISEFSLHRLGVWVDGRLSWLYEPEWQIQIDYARETAESAIVATHQELGIRLEMHSVVYNEKPIFLREVIVSALDPKASLDVRIFFGQEFRISGSNQKDTAYYDPRCKAIVHYKGRRAFLINTSSKGQGFDSYSVGLYQIEGKEGVFTDAEDGELSGNPIEHGSVDSIVEVKIDLKPEKKQKVYHWIAVGRSIDEVRELDAYVCEKTPAHLIRTTRDYWFAWAHRRDYDFSCLDSKARDAFYTSMFIIRANTSKNGAIIASSDSSILNQGRDTYSYMWPRDAGFSAMALDATGDYNMVRQVFTFFDSLITEEGYFLHKYQADGSFGSSWHPWVQNGVPTLPIQEDETAIVLFALGRHYELTKDLEFIEQLYNSMIKKAGDFLLSYTDPETGLSFPSYDLWEEKYATHTYTCAVKYGAFREIAKLAGLLGKREHEVKYNNAADSLKKAMLETLYDEELGMFVKSIHRHDDGRIDVDRVLDMSSFYGMYKFGVLEPGDPILERCLETVSEKLQVNTEVGGFVRYEKDNYFRSPAHPMANPWIITTLWIAQYYIARAKNQEDLKPAVDYMNWTHKLALPSGAWSEQVDPYTGELLSATPLTWSHAEYVVTVLEYMAKLRDLGLCEEK